MKPLAIDLFCGLGGWTEGLLAEGYDVIGFDIERHEYWMPEIDADESGNKGMSADEKIGFTAGCSVMQQMKNGVWRKMVTYPAQLVLQDVLTLHGKQFKDAALIVASPPCQEYSYMAMPWSRAKAIAAEYRSGARDVKKLTALFDACFRIQKEAIEAAGHFIPLVVENVRGAIPWVGRSRWNFGSFHLWGDVPALMPMTKAIKNTGGSWFAVAQNTISGHSNNARDKIVEGMKTSGLVQQRNGHGHTRHLTNQRESVVKNAELEVRYGVIDECVPPDYESALCMVNYLRTKMVGRKNGGDWFGPGDNCSLQRRVGSKSTARKAASAAIAKIPFPLAQHIARAWMPMKGESE